MFLAAGFLWVRGVPWGERAHLGAVTITLALDLSGSPCPLTVAEIALRTGGDRAATYQGSCVAHYLEGVLPAVPWGWVQLGGEVLLMVVALWWYRILRVSRLNPLVRAS